MNKTRKKYEIFKRLNKIVILSFFIFSFNNSQVYSQDKVTDKNVANDTKNKNIKEYTDKQLNDYVMKELEKIKKNRTI